MIQFDCHAHVYEGTNVIPGARYVPKRPAPLEEWRANLDRHDLKGGVIVQVSFLGTDNSQLCAALSRLDRSRFAGVAVARFDATDEELDGLMEQGIRGLRWNLVRGRLIPDLGDARVRAHLAKMVARDLHLELHLESARLVPFLPKLLETGVCVVVDHFGLPSVADAGEDPWLNALESIQDRSQIFVKFSAAYRTNFAVTDHAARIVSLLPQGHVVWGSDWPHTQHEEDVTFERTVQAISDMPDFDELRAPQTLYGLSPFSSE